MVKRICKESNVHQEDLSFIASHGQTIFHIPKAYDDYVPSTLQIGEAAIIANECKQMISNFRVMDMAVGGEGATFSLLWRNLLYGEDHHSGAAEYRRYWKCDAVLPKKGDEKKSLLSIRVQGI